MQHHKGQQSNFEHIDCVQNATEELKRLEEAFNAVHQGIFTRLHEVVRDQIFLTEPHQEAENVSKTKQITDGSSAPEIPEVNSSNGSRNKSAEQVFSSNTSRKQ